MGSRIVYNEELKKLNQDVLAMGSGIEKAIDKTATAVKTLDRQQAKELIVGDDVFDRMERSIEKYCIDLVIKQAPLASDWRRIASIMRIVSDLERIADHCSDISVYVLKLAEKSAVAPPKHFEQMFSVMKSMVKDTIAAFVSLDMQAVSDIIARDDTVDQLFENNIQDLIDNMKQHPEWIEQSVFYLFINKYIERMSDHSVNVAKWLPYIASGEYTI
ncbi:MAG: phosphate signaling complex protein PhoU [Intestinimonas sp.]|jgi:phosphate transport system protein|nr:phosphate signaling complex protein PhoU [Intestinimonas sp.]